jgi:uncharacterized membrane protein
MADDTLHPHAAAPDPLAALPVNLITRHDLYDALRAGRDDFLQMPTHLFLVALIYPVAGLILARWSLDAKLLPLLFPLVSGFALVGPIAAIGLYELSRRRETGLDTHWRHMFDVLKSPALATIILLAGILTIIFGLWLWAASTLYAVLFGQSEPQSLQELVRDVIATPGGWKLIVFGNLLGLGFAVVSLAIGAVSFPLALDRHVGLGTAIATSIQAMRVNRWVMLEWGLIVAVILVLGALPLLVGLAVALPVLGHATWHLYRRLVPY